MKLNTKIPAGLNLYYRQELAQSDLAFSQGQLSVAWRHLERAHILGQAYPYAHTYVHWKMLCFGINIKSAKEIRGQLLRLLVGGVKSFVGRIPVGNTGGADIDPLQPMEIPADLKQMLEQYQSPKHSI